jgi:hypothetical protein
MDIPRVAVSVAILFFESSEHVDRLKDAAAVLREIMNAPDQSIPQDLLDRAHCVVVVPGLKKGLSSLAPATAKAICSAARKRAGGPRPGP